MNVAALATCYGRSRSRSGDRPVVSQAVVFDQWLSQYAVPFVSLPAVPDFKGMSPAAYSYSSDGDGGISAVWFLNGNDVVGVPLDRSSDRNGYRVPYSALDDLPVVKVAVRPPP